MPSRQPDVRRRRNNGRSTGNVQDLKEKLWRSGELKKLEEDMPRLLEKELGKGNWVTRQRQEWAFTSKCRWI